MTFSAPKRLKPDKIIGKICLIFGVILLLSSWGLRSGIIEKVLALAETTHILPSDTAFNAEGFDDNSGVVSVGGSEVTLAKDSNWWDLSWRYKMPLTIKNLGLSEVSSNTSTSVHVNLTTLGLGTTKLQDDLDDLRVVYMVGATHTEIARSITQAIGATNVATITFPLSANIGSGASSVSYSLYYGNVGASAPGANGYSIGNKTATLVCPFNGTTTCVDGETPSVETGAIRYSGQKSGLSFDGNNDEVGVGDIGSGIKTVEFWVYPRSTTNYFIDLNGSASVSVSAGTIAATGFDNPTVYVNGAATTSLSANSWQHVAVVSDSGINASAVYVGKIGSDYMSGYIDELRVSDTVRYSVGFTAPVVAFTPDANAKLLFHFDENGDDPRNSGKAIDASGNGNHGTINGAKYVSGLVGVDASSSDTGILSWQPYAGHEGIFVEEGTTNLVPNPSFEHTTYNTSWSLPYLNFAVGTTSFTAAMVKRNSTAPFAAGVMVQGGWNGEAGDVINYGSGSRIAGDFYQTYDASQGSVVFWITPEWNGNDNKQHTIWYLDGNNYIRKDADNNLRARFNAGVTLSMAVSSWTAGSTYLVTLRYDLDNTLDGTNYGCISIGDTHSFVDSSADAYYLSAPAMTLGYGSTSADALVEGLTFYRRPLWDGQYGINAGNGDEISLINNSGAGQDPTLVTGSWDVVFALPTNATTGSLGVGGTGQAWSHPHSSNVLYTSTTNTGGFMMSGTAPTDGWGEEENGLFNFADVGVTFSAGLAKRNSGNVGATAPFSAGVMVQGDVGGSQADVVRFATGSNILGQWPNQTATTFDAEQGSVVLWWTPEFGADDLNSGKAYMFENAGERRIGLWYEYDNNRFCWQAKSNTDACSDYSVVAGTTYSLVLRWDYDNPIGNGQYGALSINDSHTYSLGWRLQAGLGDIYIGSDSTGKNSAKGIIEGFTVYRRPLWDGEYGVNVGNGDEINAIFAGGTDPTIVTGSWDVMFNLPTKGTGVLGTGTTGDAWSHPLASNVMYIGTTMTGGFMALGAYVSDGFQDIGTPTNIVAATVPERIYRGGYQWTNDAENEGIGYTLTGLTAGQNYVVRALAHSDGTSIPKVQIWDSTNDAEITSMTGTVGSGRTAPDVFTFTFELPTTARYGSAADCTAIEVRLLNTQSSGTVYWHQVEMLVNLIDNPSLEIGSSATGPWVPAGWSSVSALLDTTDKAYQINNDCNSGNCMRVAYSGSHEWISVNYGNVGSLTAGRYYSSGFWRSSNYSIPHCYNHGEAINNRNSSAPATVYGDTKLIGEVVRTTGTYYGVHARTSGSTVNFIFDDFFFFPLNPVTLTVTPASEANSTESNGLRVDGADTLTEAPNSLTTTAGTVKFNFTPRHSFDSADLFGVVTPVIAHAYYDGSNYIKLHRQNDSTLQVVGVFDGSTVAVGYTSPTLNANTTYEIAIDYTAGGNLNLYIDNTNVGSTSGVVAFANTPNIIYYGTDNGGANSNPYDGTYSAPDNNYSIAALSTSEKIFPGGYKWSNEAVNQGIGYTLSSLTAGANYVVRAVAHSDGTAIPKVQIWDVTNEAEITQLTGTVGSGRTAPDILLFTFELPTTARNSTATDCTSIEVRLLNTQNSGTVYWHQIELLSNLIDNPSFETGSGDPWMPDGWSNNQVGYTMVAGEGVGDDSVYASGSKSWKVDLLGNHYLNKRAALANINISNGSFYNSGIGIKTENSMGDDYAAMRLTGLMFQGTGSTRADLIRSQTDWKKYKLVGRASGGVLSITHETKAWDSNYANYDDFYLFKLSDVGVTATAATQANSSESSGIRVDGGDVLSQSITELSASSGVVKFKMTPRHDYSVTDSFGNNDPYVFIMWDGNGDWDNFIQFSGQAVWGKVGGASVAANWAEPVLNAGTTYDLELSYRSDDKLILKVDGEVVASAALNGASFSSVPTTIWFGSSEAGGSQYDATFSNFEASTPSENTSLPYYKFGSKSLKLTHTDGNLPDEYAINVNVGNTATHTLSAFVYDGTTGNIGGAVNNTIAQLSVGSTGIGTTYTDQGGGWWRLTGTVTGTGDTRSYGVQVKAGNTIYVDGVQLEAKSYATTFADGSLGVGYSWASTANNSPSGRSGANGGYIDYNVSNLPTGDKTISLWIKRLRTNAGDKGWGVNEGYFTTDSGNDASCQLGLTGMNGTLRAGYLAGWGVDLGATEENKWYHVVMTWNEATDQLKGYINNVYKGANTGCSSRSEDIIRIGKATNWSAQYPSDGPISDFRVYEGVLTDAEVGDLYNAGLLNHQNSAENTDRYPTSGTYISPVIDFGAIAAWGDTALSATETLLGGAVSYFTRSSSDNSTWSDWVASVGGTIASSASRYFQWKADLSPSEDRSEAPVISNMTISYVEDNTAPLNPTETASAYSAGVGTTALISGEFYNHSTPYFAWDEGTDPAVEGQEAAGVSSYHVLLTTDVGATPADNTEDACYAEVLADSRTIRVGSGDLSGCSLSNGTYYLRLQTEDASANVAGPVTLFTYKFDSSNPNAPASVSSTTIGYSATNSFTFYWPAATDVGPAGIAGYEYKTGATEGVFSDWQSTTEAMAVGVSAYTEGQNFFYVRSIDNAGNVSATTSNLGIAPFYYNASAPTKPLSVTITPSTSLTSQADENVFTVSWDKPDSYSGEIAKYHYCVNCTPSATTMTETTASETVDRSLTNVSLATQQGKNTFYIVAEDNNVNMETGKGNVNYEAYESVEFFASTVAPEAPSNVTISDTSDRDSAKWRLTLAWDVGSTTAAVPDHYEVYRSTDTTTYSLIGTVSSSAYTDTGLTQSQKYYYKVKSVDNAGASSLASAVVSLAAEGRYTTPPSAGGTPTVTAGSSTAIIAWSTSRNAYGSVEYGSTSSYGASASEASASAAHSIKVTGLQPGATYHYRVMSMDDSSLVGYERSAAYSSDYTFTTLSAAEISDVVVDEVGLDSAVITWTTRTMSTSSVDYGLTTEYGESVTVSTTSDENKHTARLSGLTHSSVYHFRILGTTVDGDAIFSQDYTFETITFPKVTAYVLKTDQSAGGTIISVAWSSNVETSSVIEYQAAEIDSEISLTELTSMSQEQLAKVKVSLKGESLQVARAELTKTHVMRLDSLEDGAMYIIRLKGRDSYGNEAVSEAVRYVTGEDTRPPRINNVSVESQISGTGDASSAQIIISWETDEEASTQVVYGQGTGSDYPLSTPEDTGLTKRHTVVIRDLAHTSSYHLKIISKDETGNVAESGDLIAVTPALQESALDVVLKNLEDVFGFLKI